MEDKRFSKSKSDPRFQPINKSLIKSAPIQDDRFANNFET